MGSRACSYSASSSTHGAVDGAARAVDAEAGLAPRQRARPARPRCAQVGVQRAAQVGQAAVVGGVEGVAADHEGGQLRTAAHCRSAARAHGTAVQNGRPHAPPRPPGPGPRGWPSLAPARPRRRRWTSAARCTAPGGGRGLPEPTPRPQPVTLPDEWARTRPGFAGTLWYRVRFERAAEIGRDELLALYIERVCSNLEVHLNGQLRPQRRPHDRAAHRQLQPPAAGGAARRRCCGRAATCSTSRSPATRSPRSGRASAPAACRR